VSEKYLIKLINEMKITERHNINWNKIIDCDKLCLWRQRELHRK